jgi:CheY-like chemotaxis protein
MPKILLAEDELDLRNFLKDELTDRRYAVTAVANGADAVVAAVEGRFDLYLLDMLMPGLDGPHTIRVLRAVTPGVPILGLTGHVGRGYMAQASEYGVTCLGKPIQIEALAQEIAEALHGARPRTNGH